MFLLDPPLELLGPRAMIVCGAWRGKGSGAARDVHEQKEKSDLKTSEGLGPEVGLRVAPDFNSQ